MQVGHFAVGMVAKRIEPKLSLGTLVLAAMLADFLWCIFMLAGIDHVEFKQGKGAANYLEATDIGMSHSLLTNAIWAALFAAAYFLWRRYRRGAWVLFVAVLIVRIAASLRNVASFISPSVRSRWMLRSCDTDWKSVPSVPLPFMPPLLSSAGPARP